MWCGGSNPSSEQMKIEKLHPWSERMVGIRLGVRALWKALQDIKLPKDEKGELISCEAYFID